MDKKQLFINGQWQDAASGKTFPSINPATGETIAQVASAQSEDVDRAVQAARAAYENVWSKINPADRGLLLFRLADLIERHADELARIDTLDAGRPLADCRAEVPAIAANFRFFAGLADKIAGLTYPVQQGYLAYTRREPFGVVGAITPWNYPFFNACSKVAPILAAGNTCVLKIAEQTPLSGLELARLAQEAGLPDGVLNVITGFGDPAGAALALHMDVDKIGFTGSTQVGRLIMQYAAQSNLKPVSLELGGKSPNILFEDANIEAALDGAVASVFYNQGQTCVAATRLLVQRGIVDAVIAGLVERAGRVVVGDPLRRESRMGAIVSEKQYERVRAYIRLGVEQGAKLVCGGTPPADPSLKNGYFMTPTLFAGVTRDMRIFQEEIFGPVLSIVEFDTEEEAVRLANDVPYGLSAAIWTRDSARLMRMVNKVQAGLVWGNCIRVGNAATPVSGYKQSGFGTEYGMEAGMEYTRMKTIWIASEEGSYRWI